MFSKMDLQQKYSRLLSYAESAGVKNLSVKQESNVLYITGSTNAVTKDYLWKLYNEIDPQMRAGDLVMNISVIAGSEELYEVKTGDNLSRIASKYPGMTWKKIFEANKDKRKDPDLIYPGQKLTIPL